MGRKNIVIKNETSRENETADIWCINAWVKVRQKHNIIQ